MIDVDRLPPGLVPPVRADHGGDGGPTPDELREPRWRRTTHGYYVPVDVDSGRVEQRILEAAVLVRGHGAVSGWAALRWLGARWFDGTDGPTTRPVPLVIGTRDIRPQAGVVLSGEGLNLLHTVVHRGVRVTLPPYAVSYEMRYATDERAAARVLSLACYDDLVSAEEQLAYLRPGQNSWTGVPRARAGVALAEENVWSPAEFDMLGVWTVQAARPTPRCNLPVFDLHGRHLATPDLIDVAAGVCGEYQGKVHLDPAQRDVNVRRDELLLAVGLENVTMTAPDLRTPAAFVERLHRAYERAGRRHGERRWTAVQPTWWTPTDTVEARRALGDVERSRFLRYRAS